MRTPIKVAVTLFPIDQLSSAVRAVRPAAYRSPIRRPLHVTTKAAVISSGGPKAASTACCTWAMSSSGGAGAFGRMSPIGQACVDGSGSLFFTLIGVKLTVLFPAGSVTHPWLPRYFAVSVTPSRIVTLTVLATRSITGFPTLARSAIGLVKYPTFLAAKSGSRPVMTSRT